MFGQQSGRATGVVLRKEFVSCWHDELGGCGGRLCVLQDFLRHRRNSNRHARSAHWSAWQVSRVRGTDDRRRTGCQACLPVCLPHRSVTPTGAREFRDRRHGTLSWALSNCSQDLRLTQAVVNKKRIALRGELPLLDQHDISALLAKNLVLATPLATCPTENPERAGLLVPL